jgi:hypothetical protein
MLSREIERGVKEPTSSSPDGVQRKSSSAFFFTLLLISNFCNYFYSKNGLTMTTMTDDNDEAFLNYYVINDGLR